eukprot:Amastigsp_a175143_665.p2 type:complete len:141 gc:universal Amastigsp_a175143_665:1-423(+)
MGDDRPRWCPRFLLDTSLGGGAHACHGHARGALARRYRVAHCERRQEHAKGRRRQGDCDITFRQRPRAGLAGHGRGCHGDRGRVRDHDCGRGGGENPNDCPGHRPHPQPQAGKVSTGPRLYSAPPCLWGTCARAPAAEPE